MAYIIKVQEFHIINPCFIKRNSSKDRHINLRNSDPILPLGRWTVGYTDLVKIN